MKLEEVIENRFEIFKEACKKMDEGNYEEAAGLLGKLAFAMCKKIKMGDRIQ